MQYSTGKGNWFDASSVTNGQKIKIVAETTKQISRYKGKDGKDKEENVTRVMVQGAQKSVDMRLNWTTIYGLIRAFGKESKDWMGHILTIHTMKAMVGDTMRTLAYLVPEGFELRENAENKLEIVKIGTPTTESQTDEVQVEAPGEPTISPEDIPF